MATRFSRRKLIEYGAAGVAIALPLTTREIFGAPATRERHGLSAFGELNQPQEFTHFGYVHPAAHKGGRLTMQLQNIAGNQSYETFDTFNIYALKGNGAAGIELTFDTLMARNKDEPDAVYGLVAGAVSISDDQLRYRFFLRKGARFHDETPVTAHDVAFSLETLRTKGHPIYRSALNYVVAVAAESNDICTVELAQNRSRDTHLSIATMPIFSEVDFAKRDFEAATLQPPLGSGPYRVARFEQGRFVEYERVKDYWAADLPVNIGRHNFDQIRYEYYRDRDTAFEAFKAGHTTYREENSARVWATQYDFPAARSGKIRRTEIPDNNAAPRQGWYFNLRRKKFSDARIREAINYCFDFEWTNKNIMYSSYTRLSSYFQNSEMEAKGLALGDELAILKQFGSAIPIAALNKPWVPPVSDGSGSDRVLLRRANTLLQAAGCRIIDGQLYSADGSPFDIEFLDTATGMQAHTEPFLMNLRRVGIKATWRGVDPVQHRHRLNSFDFDIVNSVSLGSNTPGGEVRTLFGSAFADVPGSSNIAGISDPVVDTLLDQITRAARRSQLTAACRALDRVLRASYYWVPMWFGNKTRVAYWDVFGQPDTKPKFSSGAPETWWRQPDKLEGR